MFRSCYNVIQARRSRRETGPSPLLGLAPFFGAWALITLYLHLRPEILHQHLVPFAFFVGLINAFSVGQIITAHLVKAEFPYGNVLLAPLAWGVVDSLGPWLKEHVGIGWPSALGANGYQVAFVFLCLGLGLGVYGSFVVSFCEFSNFLFFSPLQNSPFSFWLGD